MASQFSASYPEDFLLSATKNDLIYICRVHGIAVPGLPGAADYPVEVPVITVQPVSVSGDEGEEPELSVTATGSSPLYYQWYVSDGGDFTAIEGADEATYSFEATLAGDGNQYQVKVWNSAGSVYSDAVTFSLDSPVITTLSPDTGDTAGGTTITVTGTGLDHVTAFTFDGTPGTDLDVVSGTSATVKSPAHAAGAVDVIATAPQGNSAAKTFTYAD